MSEIQIILLIVAGALTLYQIILGFAFAGMTASGKYTKVRISVLPLLVAMVLAVIVVLL